MIPLPTAALLGALLFGFSQPNPPDQPSPPNQPSAPDPAGSGEPVLRTYDLSAISIGWQEEGGPVTSFFPHDRLGRVEFEFEGGGAVSESLEGILNLVLSLVGDEVYSENSRFELGEDGRLYAWASEEMQSRIAQAIRFVGEAANAQTKLLVDVVRFDSKPDSSIVPLPAVAGERAVQSWLAALPEGAHHSRHELVLRLDRSAILDLTREVPSVVDYDVEVACGIAVKSPVVVGVQSGTRLEVAGSAAVGGLNLALILDRRDLYPSDPLEVNLPFWGGGEQSGIELQRSRATFNLPRVAVRTDALSTILPEGMALVLTHEFDLAGGGQREFIILRGSGESLPARFELPLQGSSKVESSGVRAIIADRGAVAVPTVVLEGRDVRTDHLVSLYGEPYLTARIGSVDDDLLVDLADDGFESLEIMNLNRFMISIPRSVEVADGKTLARMRAETDALLRTLGSLHTEERFFVVDFEVRNHGGKAVHSRFALRGGASAATLVGVESLEIADYEVEVAQQSAVADPEIRSVLDGMCLRVKLLPGEDGKLDLHLKGGTRLAAPARTQRLAGPVMGTLFNTPSQELALDERVSMERSPDGWVARFGDLSAEGLSLSVTVTEVH